MNNRGNRGNRGGDAIVPVDDHTSPYYLHLSDNPSLQLVPQVLIGSNYINKSRYVITALIAKNKLQFVDGSLLRPNDDDDLLFSAWIRCNSMAVSWLRNSVSPQICSSVMYLDNAHDIWSDLSDLSLKVIQLDLINLSNSLWLLCKGTLICNSAMRWHTHQKDECTIQFLIGLNSSYSQIRSTILSTVPLPSLSKAFSLVIQEERQRTIDGNLIISPPVSSSEQPFSVNATSSNFGRGRLLYSHCGCTNHTVDRCFSLHSFPQGYGKGRGKPSYKDFSNSKVVNYVEESITENCDKSS
ncbi:uncharacterized protein LOC121792190 [Salvia splendens]|uniref:uncharacterized protein LOC121792190 n=1 Tax=Salvia splendens TaxID=180675 RepID=UPI001C25698F|nr:uncharacterized protein LOC121792190 [Salvia splendens]